MLPKRVLVTGASGLLGSAVVKCLSAETAVWAVGHRHAPPGMTRLDLAADGVAAAAAGEWDALVHCAAYRSPDFCEEHPQAAWRLNADVPRLLAEAAAARRAPRF
jgi:dTDP-4-dehydrorhamnose reductase